MSFRPLLLAALVGVTACTDCQARDPAAQRGAGPEPGEEGTSSRGTEAVSADPPLPGVTRVDPKLAGDLQRTLESKSPTYRPRTEHLEQDGTPVYTNRLIRETSPYLLQHAHNPVNWFPWGPEAFARALAEDKPIFLSVGYSTCHWCHVMERESFEDTEIAAFINEHFIPVKVDREERPEVDSVYMTAVNMLSGRGGWPMTVVLTPDRKPFFAGTYFPPRDGARGARRGLLSILQELADAYAKERDALLERARSLTQRIEVSARPRPPGDVPGDEAIVWVARQLAARYDREDGGFGGAPKFPQPSRLKLLLRYQRRSGDAQALEQVGSTLRHMANGGVYDHVGGGFHRYSVDAEWLVPHFEKMLYDNAQLADVYIEAWQATGEPRFAEVARETLDYVAREMTAPGGGFYSATDADSPGPKGHAEEGLFFTWTPSELEAALGPERARRFATFYGVTEAGNFEGRSILHRARPLDGAAAALSMSPSALAEDLANARRALYAARERRPAPLRDDKILAAWNGLMVHAFARASVAFDDGRYLLAARAAARRLLGSMRDSKGRLYRSLRGAEPKHGAYLEDYAAVIRGLLSLFEADGDPTWVRAAIELQAELDRGFLDGERGGYFRTREDHDAVLVREKPTSDGAMPSGNAVALLNLLRLATLTGDMRYREQAERGFAAFASALARAPAGMPFMLVALDYYLDTSLEVILIGPGDKLPPERMLVPLRETLVPNRVAVILSERRARALESVMPALREKQAIGGRPTAYVCESGRCELPSGDPSRLAKQLAKVRRPIRRE